MGKRKDRKADQSPDLSPASVADLAGTPITPINPVEQTPTPEPKAKAVKLTPAERAAARIAARDALRASGQVAKNAAGRPDARGLTCLCGCGEPTHRDDAWFKSGHDARLRKAVILGGLNIEQVPSIVRPFFELGAPIAGLLLQEDGSFADVKAGGGGLSEHHEFA